MINKEELAACFDADQLRGYSPIRNFTAQERRLIASALRSDDTFAPAQPAVERPSVEAMKAAVELEILSALGRVHTVKIGEMIQKMMDASRPQCSAATGGE